MKKSSVYILIAVILLTMLCGCRNATTTPSPSPTVPGTSPTQGVMPDNDLDPNDGQDDIDPLEPDVEDGIVDDGDGIIEDNKDDTTNGNKGATTSSPNP
ncbi:MAG TPA: hypothetical protein GXZ52_07405 [Clostridiales bacterium]|jgi:hypothetical protein|nr:hypothetical protein [Clostridiales bacterium]